MKPTDTAHLNGVRLETPRMSKAALSPTGGQPMGHQPKPADEPRDKVTLTSAARQVQELQEAAKALPDIDRQRVDAIKAAIAEGTFDVDSKRIADGLLTMSRDLAR